MLPSSRQPDVTVLMPVRNGAVFLSEAIDSILKQTLTNFEFLIINDASTDDTISIIQSYGDSRIRLIENDRPMGLAASLNQGLEAATGAYIARMDGDDISQPNRLAVQVEYLTANPSVGIVGSWVRIIGSQKPTVWRYPVEHDKIVTRLLFESALAHPSVMLRKTFLESSRLRYDSSFQKSQDYDFWVRCASHCRLANIPEELVQYRLRPEGIRSTIQASQRDFADQVRAKQLLSLGMQPTSADFALHTSISYREYEKTKEYAEQADDWFGRLLHANDEVRLYPNTALFETLAERWREICANLTIFGLWAYLRFSESPLAKANFGIYNRARLFARSGLRRS